MSHLEVEQAKQDDAKVEEEEIPLSTSLRKLLLLFSLFLTQGLCLGYYGGAIILFLSEAGTTAKALGALSIMNYPFSCKFLVAPLVDYFSFASFGKHKTYIVPSLLLFGIVQFLTCFHIDNFIQQRMVHNIAIPATVCYTAVAVVGVATDSWITTLLPKQHFSYAAAAKLIGQTAGRLISYNFFTLFHSSTIAGFRILSPTMIQLIMGALSILVALVITLTVTEISPVEVVARRLSIANPRKSTIPPVKPRFNGFFQILGRFFCRKGLLILLGFMVFYRIGFGALEKAPNFFIIRQGFKKETIALIDTILIPPTFLLGGFLGSFLTKFSNVKIFLISCYIRFGVTAINLFIVISYDPSTSGKTFALLMTANFIQMIAETSNFVSSGAFFTKIADPQISAIYLSILTAFANMGDQNAETFGYLLLDHFKKETLWILCLGGWGYCLIFLLILGGPFLALDSYPDEHWILSVKDKGMDEKKEENFHLQPLLINHQQ